MLVSYSLARSILGGHINLINLLFQDNGMIYSNLCIRDGKLGGSL